MVNKDFMYSDIVGRLANIISAELTKMKAISNFDIGDEFEIALSNLLRQALPSKYGICRGHVVTKNNQLAGDDIIVYDREASPTLRMLPEMDLCRKEIIPIDAVYAYVEAKHTLYLDGEGPQSISTAVGQVAAVKSPEREPRSHYQITDNVTISKGPLELEIGDLEHPEISNPIVGCIFSRYVSWKDKRRSSGELQNRPKV